jgi:drug/metabolite transporter (DMT)-like permease
MTSAQTELNQGSTTGPRRSSTAFVILAFAAVYIIWGSTYLAIRYAIETLPPFLMAATRFLVAGAILFSWSKLKGSAFPPLSQWRRAFFIGALLLLCGNGGVTWAEKYIASGMAALLIASEPLWVVVLNWGLTHQRPNYKVLLGVLIGMAGVALLVSGGFSGGSASSTMSLIGAGVVMVSTLAWAGGSVYSNRHPIKATTVMASGMQMLAGGSLLLLMALVTGDFGQLQLSKTSWVSIIALLYLTVFGSLVAFTAYGWLLKNVTPTRAATYAYVNPVVAVLLGWLIASEPLTPKILLAAAVIVGSVVLITTFGHNQAKTTQPQPSIDESEDCPRHPCA